MNSIMLRIRDLRVEKGGKPICAVQQMDVQQGERVSIVGGNGSGKTTLLRVMGGLENQFTGECRAEVPVERRVYVHQTPYLFRGTVLHNVVYALVARRVARQARIPSARRWLRDLGVEHLQHRQSSNLSGGERRRVALARAFATEADILLLDEPFAELDCAGIDTVCSAISALPRSTIVVSSPVALHADCSMRSITISDSRQVARE